MKLNMDCVRDTLFLLEKHRSFSIDGNCVFVNDISLDEICAQLRKWDRETVFYSLFNLDQAGFISMSIQEADDAYVNCSVSYITFAGHQFLESIRDSKTWSTIKSGLSAIGNFSLNAISVIAEAVTSAAINAFLSRNQ